MSGNELRPVARELVDSARIAQTPSAAHRERAYQALLAGLSGAAGAGAVGAGNATKVAAKTGFSWLKWALPTAVVASASLGVYLAHRPPHAAAVSIASVAATPTAVTSADAPPLVFSASPVPPPQVSASFFASAAQVAKAPSSAKPATGDLGQELALLHQALAESHAGNAADALALAQQHARQYPNSKLSVERDAIEVRSLCALGRSAEAHQLAARLRTQAPGSPVRAALEETCVGK